jgi:hypothetical protein
MGLVQIIKDKYTIWHHKMAMNYMEKRAEQHETFFIIHKDYCSLKGEEEYHAAIRRECDRLFSILEKKYHSKEAA